MAAVSFDTGNDMFYSLPYRDVVTIDQTIFREGIAMRTMTILTLLVVLIWGCLMTKESLSVVVKQMNLEDVTTSAQYIFSGRCTGYESRYDPETSREVIFVNCKITQMLKGEDMDEITFKMSKVAVDIGNAPTFKSGDEVILFLYERSTLGFTSPVGLAQGKFSVLSSATGEKVVVNGNNNSNLFQGIDKTKYTKRTSGSSFLSALDRVIPHQSGPINYQTFIAVVEGMVDKQ
jgi:hypothetical protein